MINRRLVMGMAALMLSCVLTSVGASDKLPTHDPVPGGIALVPIPLDATTAQRPPRVYFQGRRAMVLGPGEQDSATWVAAIGIPLSTTPGEYALDVRLTSNAGKKITFPVFDKVYQEQHISLSNQRQVNPDKLDLQRIDREKQQMTRAFQHWSDTAPATVQMLWPLQGEISSPFGLKRFFNTEPRDPHSGLDIAAPEGAPVRAPASASVVVSGDFFFNGRTLMLDHGHGLITMYCHLSRIDVAAGAVVSPGQTIGLVGKTGRATGPHLHWSVSLNDARINPYLLMPPQ